jgi:pyruvate dehydrogenase E2 component (dihydrolipoamide acetyltransferase)
VPEGNQDVPVNQLIAPLAQEDEDPKAAVGRALQPGRGPHKPRCQRRRRQGEPKPAAARPAATAAAPSAPVASAPAATHGANRTFASPLARRLAKNANIELNRIRGSGPHGRIIARDVEAARSGQGLAPAAGSFALPVPSDDKIRALFEPGSYDVIPHDNIRKVIARRLVEAKLTIPHFYLTLDCNIGKLLAAREEINAAAPKDKDGKPSYKLSVNDFVIKALALRCSAPDANVTRTERHNITVLTSGLRFIPGGLITPVVGTRRKSLSSISNEMKDFARVRAHQAKEYQGGSSAVSNLGGYGIKDFAGRVNPRMQPSLRWGGRRARDRQGRRDRTV